MSPADWLLLGLALPVSVALLLYAYRPTAWYALVARLTPGARPSHRDTCPWCRDLTERVPTVDPSVLEVMHRAHPQGTQPGDQTGSTSPEAPPAVVARLEAIEQALYRLEASAVPRTMADARQPWTPLPGYPPPSSPPGPPRRGESVTVGTPPAPGIRRLADTLRIRSEEAPGRDTSGDPRGYGQHPITVATTPESLRPTGLLRDPLDPADLQPGTHPAPEHPSGRTDGLVGTPGDPLVPDGTSTPVCPNCQQKRGDVHAPWCAYLLPTTPLPLIRGCCGSTEDGPHHEYCPGLPPRA